MPTYRKLHTKIIDSYDFAEMPDDFTRVFWMLLIVVVDSEGRAIDNPAWLRSKMFPLRSDVEASQIEHSLSWLAERKMIIRYQVDGRGYFQVVTFKDYQTGTDREAKSVLPAPPVKPPEPATHEEVKSGSEPGQELPGPTLQPVVVSVSVNESDPVSVKEPEPQKTPHQEFVNKLVTNYPELAFYGLDEAKELDALFDKYGETTLLDIASWMHKSTTGLRSMSQYLRFTTSKAPGWNSTPPPPVKKTPTAASLGYTRAGSQ